MTLAEQLRELRLKSGLSQKELARRAGIANTTLCDLEAGRIGPSVQTLVRLAKALGVSLDQLVPEMAADHPAAACQ